MRCDAMALLFMWETTFARNSHAGLGRPFYERNILTSMKHFRKVPTQSGVAIQCDHFQNLDRTFRNCMMHCCFRIAHGDAIFL